MYFTLVRTTTSAATCAAAREWRLSPVDHPMYFNPPSTISRPYKATPTFALILRLSFFLSLPLSSCVLQLHCELCERSKHREKQTEAERSNGCWWGKSVHFWSSFGAHLSRGLLAHYWRQSNNPFPPASQPSLFPSGFPPTFWLVCIFLFLTFCLCFHEYHVVLLLSWRYLSNCHDKHVTYHRP